MNDMTTVGRFGSGREVKRIEDEVLVAGAGRFTDDVAIAGQAILSILRSPVVHARIKSIDVAAATAMPGVLAVLTGADLVAAGVKPLPIAPIFKRGDGSPSVMPLRHALAYEVVRFVGEAVVAIVAETLEQGKDALEAVVVEYEDLPFVTGMAEAMAPGAPLVLDGSPDNCAAVMRHGDQAASDAAFAAAAHVVAIDIVNQRIHAVPMEPRSILADYGADGRLTVRMSNQMPSGAKETLCGTLDIAPDDLRILIGDVGGGFGMKAGLYSEDMLAVYAARLLKRPVKWKAARIDEFLAAMHGRDIETHAEMALDDGGRVLAYRIRTLANMGAYPNTTGILIQLMIGPWVATSIYDIPAIDFDFTAVLTNTAPTAAYRGAGRPEAIFLTERLMDKAAAKLGLDPAEIRRRNVIAPEKMPYTNAMGQVYDTGHFGSILEQGLALADWQGFASREAASRARGKLRGRGIASFLEWTGGNVFEERVTVAVTGAGTIEVFAATLPMGQGIATSYAQLVVDVFGVPIDKIKIIQGDTDRGAGFGSVGSRSLFTAGSAIHLASETTVATARDLAADTFEASNADIEYVEGVFRVAGTDRQVGLFELADQQPEHRIYVDATHSVNGPTWPNGCHVCEVEIDPDTGDIEIVAYSSVNDVGYAVNPMIVRGQLDGGAMQGIGQALGEEIRYDPSSGQAMTASMMDYYMPRADVVQKFVHQLDTSIPCKNNPLGVKGVGELGTIGATPAVFSAIADALARAGRPAAIDAVQMPVTAQKLWRALHEAA